MQQTLILYGAVLPALVAAIVLLVAWRPWNRSSSINGAWGGGLLLAAAFAVTQFGLVGWPPCPPREPAQWTVWLVLLAAAAEAILRILRPPCWIRCIVHAAFAVAVGSLAVPDFHQHPNRAAWCVGVSVIVLWSTLESLATRLRGATLPVAWLLAVIGVAVVLERSANAKLAQLAGALAAGLGVAVLVGLWRPKLPIAAGFASVLAIALPALLVNGHATTEDIPAVAFILAGLAPLGAWLAAGHEIIRQKSWKRALTAVIGVLIPAAVAVAIAVQSALSESYP